MGEVRTVVSGREAWRREVKDDVVERMRELLERAEAGEIQGVAFSAYCIDGTVYTGWTKNGFQSAIIGGLVRVMHRMIDSE